VQRFPASDAKYAYSPEHASIGTVQPGEVFQVESVEGWSGYFHSPSDFTPERHAEAEAHKWAVTGPISVEGARADGAVAVTVHAVEVVTPGIVV
jgi:acetamidase/formamidase